MCTVDQGATSRRLTAPDQTPHLGQLRRIYVCRHHHRPNIIYQKRDAAAVRGRLSPSTHILTSHRFTQADVHDFAADLLNAVLTKIEGAGTPEKVAENDHLMKCMFALPLYSVPHEAWTRRDARDRHGTSDADARLSTSSPAPRRHPRHHLQKSEQSQL
jgi:hypothetical protein